MQTPLYQWHVEAGGRIVEFAGWEMPIQYASIVEEHQSVRNSAGLFDIAHMGRLYLSGPGTGEFFNSLVTVDVTKIKPGSVKYSLITNDAGGVLDDILISCFEADRYLLVVNASNREKVATWIKEHLPSDTLIEFEDRTLEEFMLAIQGPKALSILQQLLPEEISQMKYYTFVEMTLNDQPLIVSRTGYTGEDGFELICDASEAMWLWTTLLAFGEADGLQPAGLGCRDTLRLEAAMPLYGHELSESTDPLTADLGFAVKLEKPDFHGKARLLEIKAAGLTRKRVGLVVEGKRIPREGVKLFEGASEVGEVTSGTFSPTLEKTIAMAMVNVAQTALGTKLEADLRGTRIPVTVTPLPFYKRA